MIPLPITGTRLRNYGSGSCGWHSNWFYLFDFHFGGCFDGPTPIILFVFSHLATRVWNEIRVAVKKWSE